MAAMAGALRTVLRRAHSALQVMLVCVRGYGACPLSLRRTREMMAERLVSVDLATTRRWADQDPSGAGRGAAKA